MMTRRKLLVALSASALATPFRSFAQQQSKVWRVAFLSQRHVDFVDSDYYYGPFRQGMRELGGGNITGAASMSTDIGPKQLEMLLSVVPKLSLVAVLVNPSNTATVKILEIVQSEGQKRGIKILRAEARTSQEIDNAFSLIRKQNAGALIVFREPFFQQQKTQIAQLTAKYRLPTMAGDRMYSEAGVLMSYGPSRDDLFRRTATFVDKILKGAKPADLPVEQPTKFEMFINGKTAKALGLTIPQSLRVMADKVIE